MKPPLPVTGQVGIAPPPDAPTEASQPLQPDAGAIHEFDRATQQPTGRILTPQILAAQHERELAPLRAPGPATDVTGPTNHVVQAPGTVIAASQPPHQRPTDRTRPAASADEDPVNAGPSRGIPGTAYSAHRNPKLGALELGGGFGIGDGEYFALDGREVAETIRQLMDELAPQLDSDLRLGIAASYPRYSVKLVVTVEAEAGDQSFAITKIAAAKGEIPEEIAERFCDKVTFVIKRQRREFDEQGEIETPPDALREQLGLPVPGRRVVTTGKLGPLMADVPLGL